MANMTSRQVRESASLVEVRWRRITLVLLACLAFAVDASADCVDSGEPVCANSSSCVGTFVMSTSARLEMFRSLSLTRMHCGVTRAVIAIHGRGGRGSEIFDTMMAAAGSAGAVSNTLIIAPYFPDAKDGTAPIASGDLQWDRNLGSAATYDFAMGGVSARPVQVSSFAAIDRLIQIIVASGKFPNLRTITIAGHSAGGQFAQRYAAAGAASPSSSVTLRYVVANPSSYVYLNALRPKPASVTEFQMPSLSTCRYYDVYGYGLSDVSKSAYVSAVTSTQVTRQFIARRVVYLLGDQDTTSESLDTTCFANAEGENRYRRGLGFTNYLRQYFPGATTHTRVIVPGVGHSASRMFRSPEGLQALFGQ